MGCIQTVCETVFLKKTAFTTKPPVLTGLRRNLKLYFKDLSRKDLLSIIEPYLGFLLMNSIYLNMCTFFYGKEKGIIN